MGEIYAITNLEGYAQEMRDCAAKNICESYSENLDDYISMGQMINLIKDNSVGVDDENRPLLDEDANIKIFEETSVWIHNIGLAKLAANNLVQCAWSSEENTMIFWTETAEKKDESNIIKPSKRNKRTKRKDC